MDIPILAADDTLLVINKPAGLLVHGLTGAGGWEPGTGENEATAKETVAGWLAEHYPGIIETPPDGEWPDPTRPGIVHRLDRDTSGVMVIAKTPAVLANLQRQFAERTVEKRYLALVVGAPEWEEQTVRAPVARGQGTRRRAQYLRLDDRAKDAETYFVVSKKYPVNKSAGLTHFREHFGSESRNDTSEVKEKARESRSGVGGQVSAVALVAAQPRTGRTHQIRVHLGLLGYPILGDPWYRTKAGRELAKKLNVPRLMLHAERLAFTHPTTGERVAFTASLPTDFLMLLEKLSAAPQ